MTAVARSACYQLGLLHSKLSLFLEKKDSAMVTYGLVASGPNYCNALDLGLSLKTRAVELVGVGV